MSDHVDFVIAQWAEAMPDLDASSMAVFGRMLRIMKHLGKARASALEEFGFREGEFDVLATLRRAGSPFCLTPTQLFTSLLVTSGAMTNRLNRLEANQLIERIPDPADKRSLMVGLTPKGLELIERALVVHTQTQANLLQGLNKTQQVELENLLRLVLAE
ncbi:MarR family winged helix-turn-helix transcriptional regulator [Erwinia sp.]|uniref:MarR family winged helix-turn-helix transcriptional regulator n=1 Tax=Erwinia citreus TaxID=558 RepID=UPI003C730A9D